jgi:hypothetical protein
MTPEAFEERLNAMLTFESYCSLLDELTEMGITDKAHPFRKAATEKARADKLATEEDHWFIIYEEESDDEEDLKKALEQAGTYEEFFRVYHEAKEFSGDAFLDAQRRAFIGMLQSGKQLSHFTEILMVHRITPKTPLDSIEPRQQEVLREVCEKLSSFCTPAAA